MHVAVALVALYGLALLEYCVAWYGVVWRPVVAGSVEFDGLRSYESLREGLWSELLSWCGVYVTRRAASVVVSSVVSMLAAADVVRGESGTGAGYAGVGGPCPGLRVGVEECGSPGASWTDVRGGCDVGSGLLGRRLTCVDGSGSLMCLACSVTGEYDWPWSVPIGDWTVGSWELAVILTCSVLDGCPAVVMLRMVLLIMVGTVCSSFSSGEVWSGIMCCCSVSVALSGPLDGRDSVTDVCEDWAGGVCVPGVTTGLIGGNVCVASSFVLADEITWCADVVSTWSGG